MPTQRKRPMTNQKRNRNRKTNTNPPAAEPAKTKDTSARTNPRSTNPQRQTGPPQVNTSPATPTRITHQTSSQANKPAETADPGERQNRPEDSHPGFPKNQLQIVVKSGRPKEEIKPCKNCRKDFSSDSPSKLFCCVKCYIEDKEFQTPSGQ